MESVNLNDALRWRMKTIPPTYKPWSIAFLMAAQVALLRGVSTGASAYFLGLDRGAAKKLFAQFLDGQSYTADQITFVNCIIDHLTKNGTVEPALLYERPFTDVHYGGPEGVFSDEQANELVKVLVSVNESVKM